MQNSASGEFETGDSHSPPELLGQYNSVKNLAAVAQLWAQDVTQGSERKLQWPVDPGLGTDYALLHAEAWNMSPRHLLRHLQPAASSSCVSSNCSGQTTNALVPAECLTCFLFFKRCHTAWGCKSLFFCHPSPPESYELWEKCLPLIIHTKEENGIFYGSEILW